MHRLNLGPDQIHTTPDMTVSEAAEAMERHHARQVVVGRDGQPLGVLSEQDIVAKVLARGLDPNRVQVADVMLAGRLVSNGSFLVDDEGEQNDPLWGSETIAAHENDDDRLLLEFVEGRCEECGVYSDELHEHEGLEMCMDCSGFRAALFG